jgi:hypothetical protein
MVHESSRGGDDNVRYLGKLAGLTHHVYTADYNTNPQIHIVACEHLELLHYLKREFSCRRQHQPKYTIGVSRQLLQYGYRKTGSLATTSLCAPNYVLAG